ncbi:LigA, interaptin [Legionella moravica]|uniref:LigA, interaptin n=1 Tax=Legionella moravica TaxID=39962 RepID=A0A378K2N8_9GAMM|nr:hypothetical protein [Legionella moravica]KTD30942.1 LigA, interaptin [Legionella moravica]STX63519.1 LigA, interaptin [Legionella moravica]
MKSPVDRLVSTNVAEFVEQLEILNKQDKTLSEEQKLTVKILISFGKEATENQFQLLQELKEHLNTHRVLLRDIAGLFDYPPFPDLNEFSIQLRRKDSLQLQSYIDSFDKDPKAGRDLKGSRGQIAQLTNEILEEQFDTSKLSRVVAKIQNLGDGSLLSAAQQFNLVQQVIYINAIGRECPLNVNRRSYSDLTSLSRAQLRQLSDLFIERVNDPSLGAQERINAQLNLIAVMREQYFRCTGTFLNTTQIVSILLSLNQLQHNRCVELPPDENQKDTKVFLAALQWIFVQNNETDVSNELLVKEYKATDIKDFFKFIGIPAHELNELESEDQNTEAVFKPEIVGLSHNVDVELAFRVPSHHRAPHKEPVSEQKTYSLEYLQKIHLGLNAAKHGQPIVIIAKDAEHALALNKQLVEYFKSTASSYEIKTFTGVEPAERRHQWFKSTAVKAPRIAITVPYLANSGEFKTVHSNGCLAIQSYLSKSGEARKILDNLSGFGKPSQFYAIHEENGIVSSLNSSINSNQDKVKLLKDVQENRRDRKQEKAIERYYIQSVNTIQRVVLEQFAHWQELLHQIHPRSEWKQLDSELSLIQQDLIRKLELQWKLILKESNPEGVFSNPYIRRSSSKHLDTQTLDTALGDYESQVESIWNSTRHELKEKAAIKVIPDSVYALRTMYLDQLTLSEQLNRNKLATRENIKFIQHEKRKVNRMVKSALDVNGAMLKYSDGAVQQYRQPFIQYQIKLLANDMINQINQSSLSSGVKKVLVERTNNADNLLSLELILIDYEERWLSAEHNFEKYRMQPVINDLLRVHQQSGAALNPELQTIKNIYLNNVVNDVVQKLEDSLSWAKEENRGFWYLLERSAATRAANDLLLAVEGIKRSTDPLLQKSALNNLFKKLSQHQAQLEGVWLFSFGHKNIRDTINQTLNTLNELTVIGSDKDELDLGFINQCKEEAHSEVVKEHFRKVIRELEARNSPWLKDNKDWQEIIQNLNVIQGENASLYAIAEMQHCVVLKCEELSQSKSKIVNPLIHLRGTLRSLWNEISHQHYDLLNESQHVVIKKEQIKKDLDGLAGFKTNDVDLIVGSNGNTEYFDLIVRGSGDLPLLNDFICYNSQVTQMQSDLSQLKKQLELPLVRHTTLVKLRDEQFKLLKEGKTSRIDVALFPQALQSTVRTVLELQEYASGTTPQQLTNFPIEIQNHYFDKEVINSLDFNRFLDKTVVDPLEISRVIAHLGTIKDSNLRADFIELYKKIHPERVEPASSIWSPKTWISGVASFITSPFQLVETEQDLNYQLAELRTRPDCHLREYLSASIQQHLISLTKELDGQIADEAKKIDVLHEKIDFTKERIADEKNKGGVFIRRFASISHLYDFERDLRQYKAEHPEIDVADELNSDEDVLASDEFYELNHDELNHHQGSSEFKL